MCFIILLTQKSSYLSHFFWIIAKWSLSNPTSLHKAGQSPARPQLLTEHAENMAVTKIQRPENMIAIAIAIQMPPMKFKKKRSGLSWEADLSQPLHQDVTSCIVCKYMQRLRNSSFVIPCSNSEIQCDMWWSPGWKPNAIKARHVAICDMV